jgi:hypothetical protein
MADDSSLTRTVNLWIQSVAIVLAGGWAIYTFGFKEASKSLHIIPAIDVRALDQPVDKAGASELRAYELGLSVNNASERDTYLIAGLVILYGHKVAPDKPEHFFGTRADTRDVNPQLMMRALNWQDKREVVGALFTFRGFPLSRAEKAIQQYVLFAPTGSYDILEIWTEFHVADACYGVYPLQSCYEFFANFRWVEGDCTAENPRQGETPCIAFSYRKRGAVEEPQPISRRELEKSYGHRVFQTTRMLVPPDAPILKLTKQPTRP